MRGARLLAAVLAASVLGAALAASHVSGAGPTLSLSDNHQVPGRATTVSFTASDFGIPGLGAWTIDIEYDPDIVSAAACSARADAVTLCNASFANDTVRVVGASARGITGDFAIATIVFECVHNGLTALTIEPRDLMDATPRDLQPIDAALDHGSVTCRKMRMPDTGAQDAPDGGALIALAGILAALGLAATGRGVLVRRRA